MNLLKFIRCQMVALVVICCVVFFGAQSALAQQTISYSDFSSTTGLQLNGNAAMVNNGTANVLRLTPNTTFQVGSAWFVNSLSLAQGFSTTFKFQLSGTNNAADGIAFVVQNGPSGNLAIGGVGGGIGFQGLTHSLAIEFDTFCNTSDLCVGNAFSSANEVGILSCGAGANSANHSASPAGCGIAHVNATSSILADGTVHTATITYTPPPCDCSNLTVKLDGNQLLGASFDLATLGLDSNDDAFVGFTAATGALFDNQDIVSWTFTATQAEQTTPPQTLTQGANNNITFTDPNKIDQNVMIASDAMLNGAASMRVKFIEYTPAVFNSTRLPGTTQSPNWSGGTTPIPNGTTGTPIPNANNNVVVMQQQCFSDAAGTMRITCDIVAGPSALIMLKSTYAGTSLPPNPAYFTGDDGPTATDWADITVDTTQCCSGSGGSKTINTEYFLGDKPPTITITSPASGATYVLNQAVLSNYTCTETNEPPSPPNANPNPPPPTSCAGPVANGSNIDTASVGSKTFTVSSTDAVGTTGMASVNYSVGYNICVLYDQTKSVKSGAVFPIKVSLCDSNGIDVSSSAIVLHATGVFLVSTLAGLPESPGNANPDADFRFDSTLGTTGGYIFNLSTGGLASGTYTLQFTAGSDPTPHSVGFGVK